MDFATIFRLEENLNLDKKTLVILRWIAIFGQVFSVNLVYFFLDLNFPVLLCHIVIAIGFFTNLYLQFGLKATQPERVIGKQIEAARVALTRYMKRTGKVWTRIFPNIPVSKKPTEVRMGKGKGSPEYYACRVKPGRIIFEIDGVSEEIAREALYKASAKLPIKTKFIKR